MVKLQAKPFNICIIHQAYAPTVDHEDTEKETFYSDIGKIKKYVKLGEILIVMGGMNAKVGKMKQYPVTGKHGLGERNERGQRLIEFGKEQDLVIMNTFFQHHPKNLYTWIKPGEIYRNQIDYILVPGRYKNAVTNVKTYPGADVGSDHNPLVMKMKG